MTRLYSAYNICIMEQESKQDIGDSRTSEYKPLLNMNNIKGSHRVPPQCSPKTYTSFNDYNIQYGQKNARQIWGVKPVRTCHVLR